MISRNLVLIALLLSTVRCGGATSEEGIPSLIPSDKEVSAFEVKTPNESLGVEITYERMSEEDIALSSKVWNNDRCEIKRWIRPRISGFVEAVNWPGARPAEIQGLVLTSSCKASEERPKDLLTVSTSWNSDYSQIIGEDAVTPLQMVGKDRIVAIAGGANLFPIISLKNRTVTGWISTVDIFENNVELPKSNLWDTAVLVTELDRCLIEFNTNLIGMLNSAAFDGHIAARTKYKQQTTAQDILAEQKALALPGLANLTAKYKFEILDQEVVSCVR